MNKEENTMEKYIPDTLGENCDRIFSDEYFMRSALRLAERAAMEGEVPVGAVIVKDEMIIAKGWNQVEMLKDATAHAEILAIEEGCRLLGGWRLPKCTLYVTLEPCLMCAGALINARVDRVVFGAGDPKGGAFGGVLAADRLPYGHKISVTRGILEEDCARLLADYFQKKREAPTSWSGPFLL